MAGGFIYKYYVRLSGMSTLKYKKDAYWSYALRHLEVPKEMRKKVCSASKRTYKSNRKPLEKKDEATAIAHINLHECFSKLNGAIFTKRYKHYHMHISMDEALDASSRCTDKGAASLNTVLHSASSSPILLPFVYTPYTPTFTDFAENLWFPRLRYEFKRYRARLHNHSRVANVREGLKRAINKRAKHRLAHNKKERKNRTEYRTNTLYYDVCFIIWWLTLYCRMEHRHNPSMPVHRTLEVRYDHCVQALNLDKFYRSIGLEVPELMTYSLAFKKRTAQAAGHSLKNYIGGQHIFGCNVYQYAYLSTQSSSPNCISNDLPSLYRHKFTSDPPTHNQVLNDTLEPILDPPYYIP